MNCNRIPTSCLPIPSTASAQILEPSEAYLRYHEEHGGGDAEADIIANLEKFYKEHTEQANQLLLERFCANIGRRDVEFSSVDDKMLCIFSSALQGKLFNVADELMKKVSLDAKTVQDHDMLFILSSYGRLTDIAKFLNRYREEKGQEALIAYIQDCPWNLHWYFQDKGEGKIQELLALLHENHIPIPPDLALYCHTWQELDAILAYLNESQREELFKSCPHIVCRLYKSTKKEDDRTIAFLGVQLNKGLSIQPYFLHREEGATIIDIACQRDRPDDLTQFLEWVDDETFIAIQTQEGIKSPLRTNNSYEHCHYAYHLYNMVHSGWFAAKRDFIKPVANSCGPLILARMEKVGLHPS